MTWQEKIKNIKCLKQERGSILVLTVILLPIMFAFLGFGYDFGNLYMHKARLQNVADAAALAGARAYLDSQATDNKDEIDGTVDRANGKLKTGGADIGGRPEYEYEPNNTNPQSPLINHAASMHPKADAAADEYIRRNLINLGSKVKSDQWSHYAINSDNANPKTFYRIGLYEKVPLYFLPIIKSIKSPQIVRAGAIALVVPGTTSSGGGLKINTDNFKTIFDNLITYSGTFFMRHSAQYNSSDNSMQVYTTMTGDIVYTHMDNLSGDGNPLDDKFYQHSINDGEKEDVLRNHLYNEDTPTGKIDDPHYNQVSSQTTINDPVVNTFYDTHAYLAAFQEKLAEAHFDYQDNAKRLYITGDKDIDVKCFARYQVDGTGTYYRKDDTDTSKPAFYVALDTNGSDLKLTINNQACNVYYCPIDYEGNYVRCAKFEGDSKLYALNNNNNIMNCYKNESELWMKISISGTEYYLRYADWKGGFCWGSDQYDLNPYTKLENSDLTPEGSTISRITSTQFIKAADPDFGSGKTNVYHVTPKFFSDPTDFQLLINQELPYNETTDKPLYVIIDENIQDWKIYTSANNTRPIIIVYFGKGKINCYFGDNTKFTGTIYAPDASLLEIDPREFDFEGNIITKNFLWQPQAAISSHWKMVNHLKTDYYTDEDVDDIYRTLKTQLENSENAINSMLSDNSASNQDLIDKISSGLGIDKSNLGNMSYYENLTLAQKKQLYVNWKQMYDEADDAEKNLLWPFNGLFTLTESSGGDGSSETTAEVLRLINFRTDYQDSSDPNKVVDPFVYLSLEKEDAY